MWSFDSNYYCIRIPKRVLVELAVLHKSKHDHQSRNSLDCCSFKSKFHASFLPILSKPCASWVGEKAFAF